MELKEFTQSAEAKLEAGIIRGVHILGFKSKNRREYSPAAVEKAKGLYEQASVFIDHDPKTARSAEERFGVLENVTFEKDGLRGDLKFLEAHPMAARVKEDVARDLRLFGLSHNIDGKGAKNDKGILIVESIDKVTSVDLVTGAATVNGLLESIQPEAVEDTTQLTEQITSLNEQVKTLTGQLEQTQKDLAVAKKLLKPVSTATAAVTTDPKKLTEWLHQ